MEFKILSKFIDHDITMWNPNTNYLVYLDHLKKILKHCISNNIYILNYSDWCSLLNSGNGASKIGSETHNVCEALAIITSTYNYGAENQNTIIKISREILYQFIIDNEQYTDDFWLIVQNQYLNFINNNNVFNLKEKKHIQRVCLNLLVCYLLEIRKTKIEDLKNYVKFAKENGTDVVDKITKVYKGDICKEKANILEKLKFSCNNKTMKNGELFLKSIMNKAKINDEQNNIENSYSIISGAYNMIYYGTPGSGKSYKVNEKYCSNENNVVRTTFHYDYSNSDFVGQIIPKLDDDKNVYYDFQEGPFSFALLKALKNPSEKINLIIEEINRGNVSAIFGDVFQLLDRDENGKSSYYIDNLIIKKYLNNNGINVDKIYVPSNLWIIGTMNTSDQNVFTLDTAFKRRWQMSRVINEFDQTNKLANLKIPGSRYTWKEFVEEINKAILEKNPFGLNSEDKQLGVYFVSEKELEYECNIDSEKAAENFAEKVLFYIWDDIAKFDRSMWFDDKCKSFEDLLKEFEKNKLKVFKGLFENEINNLNNEIYEEVIFENEG